jgi:hypothetical protein
LFQALPHLPEALQTKVKAYLQAEVKAFPLDRTAHTGWGDGMPRDYFDLPPEVLTGNEQPKASQKTEFNKWGLPPQNLYAMALYAQAFGGEKKLFERSRKILDPSPSFQASLPYTLNATIAGYIGFLRLAELAGAKGQPEAELRLAHLLIQRAALSKLPSALESTGFEYGGYTWTLRRFSPDQADTLFSATLTGSLWSQMPLYGFPLDTMYGLSGASHGGDYAFAIDFVWLTPEIAAFLRAYAGEAAKAAIASYTERAPYWFVGEAEEAAGEGALQPLYDRWAYFQAQAMIAQASRTELEEVLDVPVVPLGDLFYIQNLVAILKAAR